MLEIDGRFTLISSFLAEAFLLAIMVEARDFWILGVAGLTVSAGEDGLLWTEAFENESSWAFPFFFL